jgi:Na+/H+ antiporter NhaC
MLLDKIPMWAFWAIALVIVIWAIISRVREAKKEREAKQMLLWWILGGSLEDWNREQEELRKILKFEPGMLVVPALFVIALSLAGFGWRQDWSLLTIIGIFYLSLFASIFVAVKVIRALSSREKNVQA